MEGERKGSTGRVPVDRGGRWIVRLVWAVVWLVFTGVAVIYIIDPATAHWYIAVIGMLPLLTAILLRLLAVEKRKDRPSEFDPTHSTFDGSGEVFGPPPP
jgi:hypothetical protein